MCLSSIRPTHFVAIYSMQLWCAQHGEPHVHSPHTTKKSSIYDQEQNAKSVIFETGHNAAGTVKCNADEFSRFLSTSFAAQSSPAPNETSIKWLRLQKTNRFITEFPFEKEKKLRKSVKRYLYDLERQHRAAGREVIFEKRLKFSKLHYYMMTFTKLLTSEQTRIQLRTRGTPSQSMRSACCHRNKKAVSSLVNTRQPDSLWTSSDFNGKHNPICEKQPLRGRAPAPTKRNFYRILCILFFIIII